MSSKFDFTARVRSEGKITIPSELREQLNIQRGELLQFAVHRSALLEALDLDEETLKELISKLSPEGLKIIEQTIAESIEELGGETK